VAMKHVNEELPDVQRRRPEASAAVALVVERATAKNPDERYQTIAEMIDDLETALEVEAARAGSTTGEATSVLDAVPPPQRKLSGGVRWSWAAIAILVLVGGGALLAVQLISNGGFGGGGADKGKGGNVSISGATDYDPQGDGEEIGSKVELAADGDPTGTAWETEHYDSETFEGTKTGPDPGVGVYVTTTSPATPKRMIVRTPTPGWNAQVFAAPAGPPSDITGWNRSEK
jgi:eukaryotic-like serine/threonine-protein kinase